MIRWFPVVLVFVGCSGEEPPPPWLWGDLGVEVTPVFDPKLDGAPTLRIAITNPTEGLAHIDDDGIARGCDLSVQARHASGLVVELPADIAPTPLQTLELRWDGRDADGLALDPGAVQLVADLYCNDRQQGFGDAMTHLVRLGPALIDLGTVDPGHTVPLAWHKTSLRDYAYTVLDDVTAEWRSGVSGDGSAVLDTDEGLPREAPAPWTDPDQPPWGSGQPEQLSAFNVPFGAVAGATLQVEFVPGNTAVSQRSGAHLHAAGPESTRGELPPIRVIADGLVHTDDVGETLDEHTTLTGLVLPDTLGVTRIPITWRFEALAGDAWVPIPGQVTTEHDVWTLAGPTRVADGTARGASPAASWIGVLHDVAPAIQGMPADDPAAVMSALRDHLHFDPWITYNPSDSAYSSFEGRYIYWDRIWLDMGDWLDRQSGIDLYCHSMACLLSSLGNHLGIDAEYITLVDERHPTTGQRFTTRLTRAAGTDSWRQWTFNSHGIVRFDGLIWDAAVDVDGDDDPTRQPVSPVSPMELSFEAYMAILTAHDMTIVNNGRCDNY